MSETVPPTQAELAAEQILSRARVIEQALMLPLETRAMLAERLLASLDHEDDFEIHPRWIEEADRLAEEVRAGRVKTIPWEQAMRSIREELGRGA